ncbi:uncharacterized protein LOC144158291 isoform X2 [Haemaphysalis longicornis]
MLEEQAGAARPAAAVGSIPRTQANAASGAQCSLRLSISAQSGAQFPDAPGALQAEARNAGAALPRLVKVDIELPPSSTAPRRRAQWAEANEMEVKRKARDALCESIMEDFCNSSADTEATAESTAQTDAAVRAENEQLRRKLAVAERQVRRLTDALLDQMEAARAKADRRTCRCAQQAGEGGTAQSVGPSSPDTSEVPVPVAAARKSAGNRTSVPTHTTSLPSQVSQANSSLPSQSHKSPKVGEPAAIEPTCAEPGSSPAAVERPVGAKGECHVGVPHAHQQQQTEGRACRAGALPAPASQDMHAGTPAPTADVAEPQTRQPPPAPKSAFPVVDGKVQVGPSSWLSGAQFEHVMDSSSDGRCVQKVSKYLWPGGEAAQRSLTGEPPRTIRGRQGKVAASPDKITIVKEVLAAYIERHPGAPAELRLKRVRKHLRSFFTEAARRGNRRQPSTHAAKEDHTQSSPGLAAHPKDQGTA